MSLSSLPRHCAKTLLNRSSSYKDEFLKQYSQYESQRDIFLAAPASATDTGIVSLRDLIDFVAHVADCYSQISNKFAEELQQLLALHHRELESELREKIVGSLVLLRRKDVIDSSMYASAEANSITIEQKQANEMVRVDCCILYFPSLRLPQANLYALSYLPRSFPTYGPPIPKLPIIV